MTAISPPGEPHVVRGPAGALAVRVRGDSTKPAVVMTHSILSSSMMWNEQAALLAARGYRVVCVDTRGHGDSECRHDRCTMDDLGADTLAVMDALGIARAHYVGLSLGGMSGFGLGLRHSERISSLLLCDARADAPPAVAAPWDERIAQAIEARSCAPLAGPTIERWFGKPFVEAKPALAEGLRQVACATSVTGFVACARAIQGLDYRHVERIDTAATLIVGRHDGVLPLAMQDLHERMGGSVFEVIDGSGHLPNIDQPAAFNAAMLRHFERLQRRD
ncbi:MAG TPA: alpha/beta hydrolase [Burkholderiaceae bacterium]|nr:alpha/beta hydrolase [Burkholderiaceae bacterium]